MFTAGLGESSPQRLRRSSSPRLQRRCHCYQLLLCLQQTKRAFHHLCSRQGMLSGCDLQLADNQQSQPEPISSRQAVQRADLLTASWGSTAATR